MSSAPVAALIVVVTLAAVLLTSGVAKVRDPQATRDAFLALRAPASDGAAAPALPWVEIALAVLLLAAPSRWLVPVTVALVLLVLVYFWLVARALGFDKPVSCSCFGRLGRHEVDRVTLARNALLVVLAGVALWRAVDGWSAWQAVEGMDEGDVWALVAAVTAAAVAVLSAEGCVTAAPPNADAELLDYDRRPIPYGVLTVTEGRTATLAELAATQARLLVVLSPACGPCIRTAEKLDGWAAELTPPWVWWRSTPPPNRHPVRSSTTRSSPPGSPSSTSAGSSRSAPRRRSSSGRTGSSREDRSPARAPWPGFVADVLVEVPVQPFVVE